MAGSLNASDTSSLSNMAAILQWMSQRGLIETHSFSNQSFADDTATSVLSSWSDTRRCFDHAGMPYPWREDLHDTKQTEMNDKTQALLVKSNRSFFLFFFDAQLTSLRAGTADIPFKACACNFGFIISYNNCNSWQAHFNCLPSCLGVCLGWGLDASALPASTWLLKQSKTLVCVFVLSRLDCCNSLLSGCPLYLLSSLQKVQNWWWDDDDDDDELQRMVFRARKHYHPFL